MLWVLFVALARADMQYMKMCAQDDCVDVSRIGLGTLHVGQKIDGKADMKDPQVLVDWMNNALDQGINYLDMADVYPIKNTENGEADWRTAVGLIGQAFELDPTLQDKFFFNCKMGIESVNTAFYIPYGDLSVEYISGQVEWYFEQLPTVNKLDSIMLHIPDMTGKYDPAQMAQLFKQLKDEGKVDHFGVANFETKDFDTLNNEMMKYGMHLMTFQTETSVYHVKMDGFAQYTKEVGVSMQAWSSLAGEAMGDPNLLFEEDGAQGLTKRNALFKEMTPIAKTWGTEENVVALAWVLRVGDNVMALVGTSNQQRLRDLMAAFDNICKLTDDQWWAIAHAGGYCEHWYQSCDFELPPANCPGSVDSASEKTGRDKYSSVNPVVAVLCILATFSALFGCAVCFWFKKDLAVMEARRLFGYNCLKPEEVAEQYGTGLAAEDSMVKQQQNL